MTRRVRVVVCEGWRCVRDAMRCRTCGALLGHLNRHHDKIELTQDAALFVEIGSGGIDLVCKGCGHSRPIRGGRSFRRKETIRQRGILDAK